MDLTEKVTRILTPYMRVGVYPQEKWAKERAQEIIPFIKGEILAEIEDYLTPLSPNNNILLTIFKADWDSINKPEWRVI